MNRILHGARNLPKLRTIRRLLLKHFKLSSFNPVLRIASYDFFNLKLKGYENFEGKDGSKNSDNQDTSQKNPNINQSYILSLLFTSFVAFIVYNIFTKRESPLITQEKVVELIKEGKVKKIKRKSNMFIFYGDEKECLGEHVPEDKMSFIELINNAQMDSGVKVEDLINIEVIEMSGEAKIFVAMLLLFLIFPIIITTIAMRRSLKYFKSYKDPKKVDMELKEMTESLKKMMERNSPGQLGRAKAAEYGEDKKINITFKDVAGMEGPKEEIQEFVEFLKSPGKFQELGAKIPKGALLSGPPGTGKTLLAKACAGEAKVPFFVTSGSEFIEMYVGVGAARVRDLFERAKEKSPCIVFIDEIDAIGKHRAKLGFNDERESTLNQIFVELDGFKSDTNIVVFAATNQKEALDNALIRPGRFDRMIEVNLPSIKEREDILKVHLREVVTELDKEVIARKLSQLTMGMSGAELASICNEAAILAARNSKAHIDMIDFYEAYDRVLAGLKRKLPLKPGDKQVTAYHEAGHTTVAWYLENAQPVLKVSIVPRSKGSLGHTIVMPSEVSLYTKQQIEDMICTLFGGRASEEVFLESITTGAQDDIQKATQLAKAYVGLFGMTKDFDCIAMMDSADGLGGETKMLHSNKSAEKFDRLVNEVCEKQYERAKKLLAEKRQEVGRLADRLVQKETVELDDLNELLGKKIGHDKEEFGLYLEDLKEQKASKTEGEKIKIKIDTQQ